MKFTHSACFAARNATIYFIFLRLDFQRWLGTEVSTKLQDSLFITCCLDTRSFEKQIPRVIVRLSVLFVSQETGHVLLLCRKSNCLFPICIFLLSTVIRNFSCCFIFVICQHISLLFQRADEKKEKKERKTRNNFLCGPSNSTQANPWKSDVKKLLTATLLVLTGQNLEQKSWPKQQQVGC